jgi:hypothetical protein
VVDRLLRETGNMTLTEAVTRREPLGCATRTVLVVSILTSLLLASCSGANTSRGSSISSTTASPSTTSVPTTTTTTVPVEPGWTPVTTGANGVIADQRNVTVPDGRQITVVRFRAGQVRCNLHIGNEDPPTGAAVLGPESLSFVSTTEIPQLLGALNGGFKVNAAAGGVEVEGQTLTPLIDGFASFVIDTNGIGRIGVWGSTAPRGPGLLGARSLHFSRHWLPAGVRCQPRGDLRRPAHS